MRIYADNLAKWLRWEAIHPASSLEALVQGLFKLLDGLKQNQSVRVPRMHHQTHIHSSRVFSSMSLSLSPSSCVYINIEK